MNRNSKDAWRLAAILLAMLAATAEPADAQTAGEITLTATATAGQEGMRPDLSWSTKPAADDCTASGGWSGSKGSQGSETLPPITSSTVYAMTCTWGDHRARVHWTAPTTLINGQPLTDLAGFNIYYGSDPANLGNELELSDPGQREQFITGLPPGTWHFSIAARRFAGNTLSARSNPVSKTLTGAQATATRDIAITISPAPPNPPTNVQVE